MFSTINRFFHRLRLPSQHEAARAALYAQVHAYRRERAELLARIGEEVAVWHRAGGENERLLTESLRIDLTRLGELEEAIAAALPYMESSDVTQEADNYSPRGSMLADADGQPQVISRPPVPGITSPEPAR